MSYAIKDEEIVSLKLHDGISKKLDEIQYIPSFSKNQISLSKLDSSGYTWRADDDEILKVIHESRVILQEKKYRGYYILTKNLVPDKILDVDERLYNVELRSKWIEHKTRLERMASNVAR